MFEYHLLSDSRWIWGLGHYLYAVASGLFERVLNVFTISMGLIDKQAQTRYDSEGVQPLEVVIQVRYGTRREVKYIGITKNHKRL